MRMYRMAAAALWLLAAGLLAGSSFIAPALAADPLGTWLTGEKDAQVRITNCGGAICGSLVWLKEPNDPATGRPKTDKNNTDAAAWRCDRSRHEAKRHAQSVGRRCLQCVGRTDL